MAWYPPKIRIFRKIRRLYHPKSPVETFCHVLIIQNNWLGYMKDQCGEILSFWIKEASQIPKIFWITCFRISLWLMVLLKSTLLHSMNIYMIWVGLWASYPPLAIVSATVCVGIYQNDHNHNSSSEPFCQAPGPNLFKMYWSQVQVGLSSFKMTQTI